MPAAAALLVVEITSKSDADHDRIEKLHGYATAGVPLHLLLDSGHSGRPTATLYGQPKNAMYRELDTVEYGEGLRIPAPSPSRSTRASCRLTSRPASRARAPHAGSDRADPMSCRRGRGLFSCGQHSAADRRGAHRPDHPGRCAAVVRPAAETGRR
ncbi:Uma2 family endonuclease [Streptomyces wuyuanensis]|uniref:Uma2 family endonuclease n=1 Tax=Streptomyces wuyuanensis TaxID=1196353 RepID=UPI003139246F